LLTAYRGPLRDCSDHNRTSPSAGSSLPCALAHPVTAYRLRRGICARMMRPRASAPACARVCAYAYVRVRVRA